MLLDSLDADPLLPPIECWSYTPANNMYFMETVNELPNLLRLFWGLWGGGRP